MSSPVLEDSSLERLRALLLEEGGLMAGLVDGSAADGPKADGPEAGGSAVVAVQPSGGLESSEDGAHPAGPAQLAAAGPRVKGHAADYELLIETIYEGYLLHYRAPRVVLPREADLGVLAGDRLYALGLAHLVRLGDVEAVAELADVITLTALAHGAGNADLAEAVWGAGARAVGWGATARHDHAKALTRAGSPAALEAMRELARG